MWGERKRGIWEREKGWERERGDGRERDRARGWEEGERGVGDPLALPAVPPKPPCL